MTSKKSAVAIAGALAFALGTQAHAASKCPSDSVRSATACMDKYEASVWKVPGPTTINKKLLKKIQQGKATLQDLTDGGATQLGVATDNFAPCNDDGSACTDVFAVSVAGATPSARMTWFQAQQACTNAGKRLPSNAEWQAAVAGTPDLPDNGTTNCNTLSEFAAVNTGSRSACVSSVGAFDMAGNVMEWVADWVPASTACPGWGGFSNDQMCLSGASTLATAPGALLRGGYYSQGLGAGPLAVETGGPSIAGATIGVRCTR